MWDDAIFVRDGVALEGGSQQPVRSDRRGARDGPDVQLHPARDHSRAFVLDLADGLGIPTVERAIMLEELQVATELFFTGTTTEIRPTVKVDGRPIGTGRWGRSRDGCSVPS